MADHGRADVVKEQLFGNIGAGVIYHDLFATAFLAMSVVFPCRQNTRQNFAPEEPVVQGKVEIWPLGLDRGNRGADGNGLGELCGDLGGRLTPGFGEGETRQRVIAPGRLWGGTQQGDDGLWRLP